MKQSKKTRTEVVNLKDIDGQNKFLDTKTDLPGRPEFEKTKGFLIKFYSTKLFPICCIAFPF